MIDIPAGLIAATMEREGEQGREWLQQLPETIARFVQEWQCEVDGDAWHGGVSLVLPVRRGDDLLALKVSFPHPDNRGEGRALRRFAGHGAIRLLASDEDGFVLLVERAGNRTLHSVPLAEAIESAGHLATQLAIPARVTDPSLAGTTAGWADQLDRQVRDAPGLVPRAVIDAAGETIRALASDTTTTLLHGDLHFGNVLDAVREPWLAIDPKGWRGTAAYDAFTVVAGLPGSFRGVPHTDAEIRHRVHRFATAARVSVDVAIACTQARGTSSYLHQHLRNGQWFDDDFLHAAMTLR